MTLDEIATAAAELKRRQQRERIRQMNADMADEINRIKAEDWQAPPDVERIPEELAPADWRLVEEMRRQPRLAEETPDDSTAGYTIYTEDTD